MQSFTNKTYYFEQMFVTLFRCRHVPCFLILCLTCFAEYTDDEAHIPKHSSVIVRRTPIGGVKPAGRTFIVYVYLKYTLITGIMTKILYVHNRFPVDIACTGRLVTNGYH